MCFQGSQDAGETHGQGSRHVGMGSLGCRGDNMPVILGCRHDVFLGFWDVGMCAWGAERQGQSVPRMQGQRVPGILGRRDDMCPGCLDAGKMRAWDVGMMCTWDVRMWGQCTPRMLGCMYDVCPGCREDLCLGCQDDVDLGWRDAATTCMLGVQGRCVPGLQGSWDDVCPGYWAPAPGSALRCHQMLLLSRRKPPSPLPLTAREQQPLRRGSRLPTPTPPDSAGHPRSRPAPMGASPGWGPLGRSRGWVQSSPLSSVPRSPSAPAQSPALTSRGVGRASPTAEGSLVPTETSGDGDAIQHQDPAKGARWDALTDPHPTQRRE